MESLSPCLATNLEHVFSKKSDYGERQTIWSCSFKAMLLKNAHILRRQYLNLVVAFSGKKIIFAGD